MRRLGAFVGIVVAMLALSGAAPVTAGLRGTEARLLAVSDGDGAVYEIPIGGGPATNIGTSGFDTGTGLAYDPNTGTLFAIDYNTGGLFSVPLSGGPATSLGLTGIVNPCGLEYDPSGNQLWVITYSNPATLYTVPVTGGAATEIGDVTGIPGQPCGLAYDPSAGVLYTADFDNTFVYSVPLAAGAATAVADLGFATTCGLAFDTDTGRLLGVDEGDPSNLWEIPVNGDPRVDLGSTEVDDLCGTAFIPAVVPPAPPAPEPVELVPTFTG